jgi:glycosyltransferase involved in cell wall biosynthesis
MKKKLVLNIFTSLDFGGVESHALMLSKGSEKTNYKHEYLALEKGGDVQLKLESKGNKVHVIGLKAKIPSIRLIYVLYKWFKKVKPDIVHTRGAEASFHGLIAAFFAGVPIRVAEEIGIPTHKLVANLTFKFCYLFSHRVIAISKAVQSYLIQSGEVPKHKSHLIYNPTEFFPKQISSAKKVFTIGFIGRLEQVKNPIALVSAINELKKEGFNIFLELVGDGTQKNNIECYVATHQLESAINIHGFQSEPFKYIKHCNLYVQPSISEGFGIAVVEVMGAGIPVLASSVGGIPEFIEHNKNGWLLNSTDPESIAESIKMIMYKSKSELLDVGEAGRVSVVNKFTLDNYISNLHSLYDDL